MKNVHYSEREKREILRGAGVSELATELQAKELDHYTFAELQSLLIAIKIIAKGKKL